MIVTKKNFFKISLNPCIFSCCLAVLAQSDQALSFNSPSSVTGTMDETRERQQKGALEGFDAWKQKPSGSSLTFYIASELKDHVSNVRSPQNET